jgi:aspartyl-tRNA synthetase
VKALRVPGGASFGRNRLDGLVDRAKELGAKGLAWFKVTSSEPAAVDSPLDKFLGDPERSALVTGTGAAEGDLVLVVADQWSTVCGVLGALRLDLGRMPITEGGRRFCWVTDFPLFEGVAAPRRPGSDRHRSPEGPLPGL